MKFQLKGNFFNGEFHQPATTGPHAVENFIKRNCPSDLSLKLWECPVELRHVDKVIEAAVNAHQTWRKVSLEDRIKLLKKYQEEVSKRKEEIALAIAWEMGKPL